MNTKRSADTGPPRTRTSSDKRHCAAQQHDSVLEEPAAVDEPATATRGPGWSALIADEAILRKILEYVGPKQFRFVAPVNRQWKRTVGDWAGKAGDRRAEVRWSQ